MKTFILGLVGASTVALTAGAAAAAQPYGARYGNSYYDTGASYGRVYDQRDARFARSRDTDRDGIPDRAEWNRDRDRDGVLDQYDRYDNRRDRHRNNRGYYGNSAYGNDWGRYDNGYYRR